MACNVVMDKILEETLKTAEENIKHPDCMSYIGPLYKCGYIAGVKDMIKMIRDAYENN